MMQAPEKKSHKKSNWIRTALLVVIALALGLGIYNWNAMSLSGSAMPMPFGIGMAVVVSGSMEPELSVNDLIFVRPAETYHERDVVVFQTGKTLVVHRIISIDGEEVITQGDANNTPDEPIKLSDIQGRVVFAVPFVGMIVDILKSPAGTVAVLLLAGWLYYKSLKKERQEDEKELDRIREEIEKIKKQ